jgi:hypothetical protein
MKKIKVREYGSWTAYTKYNKEPLEIVLSGAGRILRGKEGGTELTNVKFKYI